EHLALFFYQFTPLYGHNRQKPGEMFDFCLPPTPKTGRADLEVDKNREKCLIFVYRRLQKRGALNRK
ncbi:MAG: hypothetical protein ACIRZM_09460, partial [Ligilactobacillus ruminis]